MKRAYRKQFVMGVEARGLVTIILLILPLAPLHSLFQPRQPGKPAGGDKKTMLLKPVLAQRPSSFLRGALHLEQMRPESVSGRGLNLVCVCVRAHVCKREKLCVRARAVCVRAVNANNGAVKTAKLCTDLEQEDTEQLTVNQDLGPNSE